MFKALKKRLAKAAVDLAADDPRLVRQLVQRLMSTRRAWSACATRASRSTP